MSGIMEVGSVYLMRWFDKGKRYQPIFEKFRIFKISGAAGVCKSKATAYFFVRRNIRPK